MFDVRLKFNRQFGGRSETFIQNYRCFDYLTAYRVWRTGYSALVYRRVSHKHAFYLERSYTIARTFNHIVITSDEPNIIVFVFPDEIARMIYEFFVARGDKFFTVPISRKQSRGLILVNILDYEFTRIARATRFAFRIDYIEVIQWRKLARRAEMRFKPREIAYKNARFGLSETFVYRKSRKVLKCR